MKETKKLTDAELHQEVKYLVRSLNEERRKINVVYHDEDYADEYEQIRIDIDLIVDNLTSSYDLQNESFDCTKYDFYSILHIISHNMWDRSEKYKLYYDGILLDSIKESAAIIRRIYEGI